MSYYSTQATIEAKATSNRVRIWGDKNADGTIDPASLSQALAFAKSRILAHVWRRYGDTEINSWTDTTAPDLIKGISDDLALYYLASGANAVNPVIDLNYKDATAQLVAIRDGLSDIPLIHDDSYPTLTEQAYSDYFGDETEEVPVTV